MRILFQNLLLLFFLALLQKSGAWITFYRYTNFQNLLQNYTQETTSCVNLDYSARQRSASIRTNRCISLYFQSNCAGGSTQYAPGPRSNLHTNNYKVSSFRYCRLDETIWKTSDVRFYTQQNLKGGSIGYSSVSESCTNLDSHDRGLFNSMRNSRCIRLFDTLNCGGYGSIFNSGSHNYLKSIRLVSFRSCPDPNVDNLPKYSLKLYRNENLQNVIYDKQLISNGCYLKNSNFEVGSLETAAGCVTLFTRTWDCSGEANFAIPSGTYQGLPQSIRWGNVQSFQIQSRECPEGVRTPSDYLAVAHRDGSGYPWIIFYHRTHFRHPLQNYTATSSNPSTCVNLHDGVKRNSTSFRTNECVFVYFQINCEGDWTRYPRINLNNLHNNNNRITSIRFCRPDEAIRKTFDVTFFTNQNFQGGPIGYENIDASCKNLIAPYQKTSQSMRNSKCIILFDEESCKGASQMIRQGSHRSLHSFNRRTVSFRSCPPSNLGVLKYQLKLYRGGSFQHLIYDDRLVGNGCYEKLSAFPVMSIVNAARCLNLFTGNYDCSGHPNFAVPSGNYHKLPNDMQWGNVRSFRVSNETCNNRIRTPPTTTTTTTTTTLRPHSTNHSMIPMALHQRTSPSTATTILPSFLTKMIILMIMAYVLS